MAGLSLLAAVALSCSDRPTEPPLALRPYLGWINVEVTTTGGDLDTDGYQLSIDADRRVTVGPNASVFVDSVRTGTHLLSLEGIAGNCVLISAQSRSVSVQAAATVRVAFSVGCDLTGVNVNVHTTGIDQPLGFDVQIGDSLVSVAPNESRLVSRLTPGAHTIGLTGIAPNCGLLGDNPVTVDVVNRHVSPVDFNVTCAQTAKRIAFGVDTVTGNVFTRWIFVADSNGAGARPFSEGTFPAWSPDGKKLVISKIDCHQSGWDYDYECSGGLIVIDPETRTTTVLTNDSLGIEPSWSPDGNYMAFTRLDGSGYYKLFVSGLDGSPAVKLDLPAVREAHNPAWSPDSKTIAFQCRVAYGDLEICVVNRDATGFRQLTTNRDLDDSPAWSPDGSTIAFTNVQIGPWDDSGTAMIALMTPSGTNLKLLTGGFDPAWSPTGSKLVFARAEGLFTIDADGSNLKQITSGRHLAPAWRP